MGVGGFGVPLGRWFGGEFQRFCNALGVIGEV